MSDFSRIIEIHDSVEDFPVMGNPEVTYRVGEWGYDYEWVGVALGEYVKCNPQIRRVRDTDELPERGLEGVLYVIHSGMDDKRFCHWVEMRSPIDTGYVPITEEEFFNRFPCPSRVTAAQAGIYLDQEAVKSCRVIGYPDMSDFPRNDFDNYFLELSTNRVFKFSHRDSIDDVVKTRVLTPNGGFQFFDSKDGFPEVVEENKLLLDSRMSKVYHYLPKVNEGSPFVSIAQYGFIGGNNMFFVHCLEAFPNPGMADIVYMDVSTKIAYRWEECPENHYSSKYVVDEEYEKMNSPTAVAVNDPGARAREKLTARQKAAKGAKRLFWTIVWLVIMFSGSIGVFAYDQWEKRVTEWRTDYHMCYAKVGNTIVEGQRKYRYPATTVMGFRFLDSDKVEETTYIKSSGLPYRLVGYKGADTWIHKNESGARPTTELRPADNYTFISLNDITVVSYAQFCGGTKPSED